MHNDGRWHPRIVWSACMLVAVLAVIGGFAASGEWAAASANATSGASALERALAVLRRPQTAADQLALNPASPHPAHGANLPALTRLVSSLPGVTVFLVVNEPLTTGPGHLPPLWSPRLGDQIATVAVIAGRQEETAGAPAADLPNATQVSYIGSAGASTYVVGIVPDGVARVRWTFAAADGRRAQTAWPTVANNVAIAPGPAGDSLTSAEWFAGDGRRIRTSDAALASAQAARQAFIRAALIKRDRHSKNRPAPVLLDRFPVFSRQALRHTVGGVTVSRPSLASLPLGILSLASNGGGRLDASQTRQIVTRSGIRFWIVPGATDACIFNLEPGPGNGAYGSCPRNLATLEADGITEKSQLPNGKQVTTGIVPDTNATVRYQTNSGKTSTVPVINGVFAIPLARLRHIYITSVNGNPSTS
jgi:hypothetical protein